MFSVYNFVFNYIDIVSIATIYLIALIYACNTLFFNNALIGKSFIYAIIALISIMTSFLINILTNGEIRFLHNWTIPSVILSSLFFIYISKDNINNKEVIIESDNYKEDYNEEYNYSKTRCNFSHRNCYFDHLYQDINEVEKKQKEMNEQKLKEIKDFNKGIIRNTSNINNDKNDIAETKNKKIENKNATKQTNESEGVSTNSEDEVLFPNNIKDNDIKNRVNCTKLSGDRKNEYYKSSIEIKPADSNRSVLDITEKTLEDKIIVQVKKVASELINKEEKMFTCEIKQIKSDVQMLRDSLQGVINRMAKLFSLMTAAMKH